MNKNYKYLHIISAFFVAVLIISNITSTKIVSIWGFSFDGWTLLFPISYIFWDILTEVYGYAQSRKIIRTWFLTLLFMSAYIYLVWILPSSTDRTFQNDYMNILWSTWRIVAWSLVAYSIWEFINSYIIAKIKVYTNGKFLRLRAILSTLFGQFFDTIIFLIIAFYGILPNDLLINIFISNYIFKILIEIMLLPITYIATDKLKKIENEDYFDKDTNFNPLAM